MYNILKRTKSIFRGCVYLNFGASTACLYPMESERSLKLLCEYGYKHFEFFINSVSELRPDYIAEFKKTAEDFGADFVSIHPFTSAFEGMLFFSDYERRTLEGIDLYKRFFEASAFLGADFFVLHGQKVSRNGGFQFDNQFYFDRFCMLSENAKSFGITLCQENVEGFRSQSVEFIRNMHDSLGEKAAFVFDIKQSLISGEDPNQLLAAMGSALRHVHLSDNDVAHSCLLPGMGDYDIKGLVKRLQADGYTGNLITEVYRSSFGDVSQLKLSEIYMKNMLQNSKFA